MQQPSGSRRIAAAFAIAFIVAACGLESQSPTESSHATPVEPSAELPSRSPAAGESMDPAPAEPAGDPDEILLRMDLTPDNVYPGGLGGAGWYAPGPDFTLYGDGTIIFRDFSEDVSNPQNDGSRLIGHSLQTGRLTPDQVAELLRYALDEGGLEAANSRYPTEAFDLVISAAFEIRTNEIEKRVWVDALNTGAIGPDGLGLDSFSQFSGYLSHIDEQADLAVEAWAPDRYWGHLREILPHEVSDTDPLPWPWADIQSAGWVGGRRSLLPDDVAALGLGDLSGGVCCVQVRGPDGAGQYSLEVAPAILTPLRSDAMAEVVTKDLVVRSQPGTGPESEI